MNRSSLLVWSSLGSFHLSTSPPLRFHATCRCGHSGFVASGFEMTIACMDDVDFVRRQRRRLTLVACNERHHGWGCALSVPGVALPQGGRAGAGRGTRKSIKASASVMERTKYAAAAATSIAASPRSLLANEGSVFWGERVRGRPGGREGGSRRSRAGRTDGRRTDRRTAGTGREDLSRKRREQASEQAAVDRALRAPRHSCWTPPVRPSVCPHASPHRGCVYDFAVAVPRYALPPPTFKWRKHLVHRCARSPVRPRQPRAWAAVRTLPLRY